MKKNVLRALILLVGLLAVGSSWFSVRPAADHRYDELMALHEIDSDLVSAQEWIVSEDDAGFTAFFLLLFGLPTFLIVTLVVILVSERPPNYRSASLYLGISWLILGGLLHAFVWHS